MYGGAEGRGVRILEAGDKELPKLVSVPLQPCARGGLDGQPVIFRVMIYWSGQRSYELREDHAGRCSEDLLNKPV